MRIAFIVRSTFYSSFGGDTVHSLSTAEYLRLLGAEVDILPTHEPIDYSNYDLLHFFNIIRPDDILKHIRKSEKPFVVSSVYVDYSFYSDHASGKRYQYLFRFLSADGVEYVKRIARSVMNGEPWPSLGYITRGQKRSILYILKRCAFVLPNSASELNRLKKDYQVNPKAEVIPYGVDANLFAPGSEETRDQHKVLCVGRIELRKNQLNLIKALNNTEFSLYIIGKASPNHQKYLEECKSIAKENIHFIDHVEQHELADYYRNAKVHVLPSWFETTGLSTLEAAYMGCNVVITDKGDTRDYFGDDAFYCNPDDPWSIYHAVQKAAKADPPFALQQKIRESFTWNIAAQKTLDVYQSVLTKK